MVVNAIIRCQFALPPDHHHHHHLPSSVMVLPVGVILIEFLGKLRISKLIKIIAEKKHTATTTAWYTQSIRSNSNAPTRMLIDQ